MKKIVLSLIVMLLCTAMAPKKPSYHSGLKAKLVGTYNKKPQQLYDDMLAKKDIFQDPDFYNNFVEAVRYATQKPDLTFEQIMSKIKIGGAPSGFIKEVPGGKKSSTMISRWSPNLDEIYWSTRDPRPGEVFFWYEDTDGDVCILSVDCGNYTAPRLIEPEQPEDENGEDYCDIEQKQKPLSKRVSSGGGDVIVNINMHDFGNATATASPVINNTLSAPAAPSGELGGSNLNLGGGGRRFIVSDGNQLGNEVVVRQKRDGYDFVDALNKTANTVFNGINTFRGIKFAQNNNSFYQPPILPQPVPQQVVYCCRLGHPNCTNPHLGNGGNGGGANRYNWSPPGQP